MSLKKCTLPPQKLHHAGSLYFSEKKWNANTTATKSNTPEKSQHMTDLWMEAAMEDRNATLSFPGHHEV